MQSVEWIVEIHVRLSIPTIVAGAHHIRHNLTPARHARVSVHYRVSCICERNINATVWRNRASVRCIVCVFFLPARCDDAHNRRRHTNENTCGQMDPIVYSQWLFAHINQICRNAHAQTFNTQQVNIVVCMCTCVRACAGNSVLMIL